MRCIPLNSQMDMPEVVTPLGYAVRLIYSKAKDRRCMGLLKSIPQLRKGQAFWRRVQQLCAGGATAQLRDDGDLLGI